MSYRKRSLTCAVIGCTNNEYNLESWKDQYCNVHKEKMQRNCGCTEPYELHGFPAKRQKKSREVWQRMINRTSPSSKNNLFTIKSKMRVCSNHFPDKKPTDKNPYPTENLGYESASKIKILNPNGKRNHLKKRSSKKLFQSQTQNQKTIRLTKNINNDIMRENIVCEEQLNHDQGESAGDESLMDITLQHSNSTTNNDVNVEKQFILQKEIEELKQKNSELQLEKENLMLVLDFHKNTSRTKSLMISNIKLEHSICLQPMHKKLLTSDKQCLFYTGVKDLHQFYYLHQMISPYVKRRWRGLKTVKKNITKTKSRKKSLKQPGPKRKLASEDEFLMMLMKLKLALLTEDLASRFQISVGLTSTIITTWIKVTSQVLKALVFVPDYEKIKNTVPERFRKMGYGDTHSILDGTEFFIETPKNLDLQKITWSEYKHHNTLKVLICIAPNSSILFVSKAFGGSISDKEITIRSGFLDLVPKFGRIMYDKGFHLHEECAERMINVSVPPGRKGSAQMTPKELRETKRIANLRILVEQVIRRIKTFRILAVEYPISMLKVFDDVLIICSAISNLKKPIILH